MSFRLLSRGASDETVMTELNIRSAAASEALELSELALRSKAHWGYSTEFIDACRAELLVRADRLAEDSYHCFVAECDGNLVGFGAVAKVSSSDWELDALFVEPEHIGTGIGRALVDHAISTVTKRAGKKLLIQGDPHAEHFYLAVGAVRVGERESGSIPGRMLPLFRIPLAS